MTTAVVLATPPVVLAVIGAVRALLAALSASEPKPRRSLESRIRSLADAVGALIDGVYDNIAHVRSRRLEDLNHKRATRKKREALETPVRSKKTKKTERKKKPGNGFDSS
jgi:hypothetical protein